MIRGCSCRRTEDDALMYGVSERGRSVVNPEGCCRDPMVQLC